ncbi:MAG: metallophosphoesterase family protein [Bacillota bacterium]
MLLRNKFRLITIVVAVFFTLNISFLQSSDVHSATATANKPFNINATINGSPKTQMGFAWYANPSALPSSVQLLVGVGKVASDFQRPTMLVFSATKKSLTNVNYSSETVKKSFDTFKALATGLKANTTYSYRVGNDKDGWSAILTFTTAIANTAGYDFIYVSDTQSSNSSNFRVSSNTLINAAKKIPSAKFALITGDLVDNRLGMEWEWEQFFGTMKTVWGKMPIVPVLGNHDSNYIDNFSNHFNTAPLPTGMSVAKPGTVYSFEYGDALFMVLNTELANSTAELDRMVAWMTKVANASTKKWKIAAFHRGLYTGSSSYQMDSVSKIIRKKFAPVFDKLHIDLALQGHSHVYEVIGPVKAGKLVSGAVTGVVSAPKINANGNGKKGGTFNVKTGTLYFLNNASGVKFYTPRSKADMNSATTVTATGVSNYNSLFTGKLDQPNKQTFTCVNVSTSAITLTTYLVDSATGGLVSSSNWDSFKIVK